MGTISRALLYLNCIVKSVGQEENTGGAMTADPQKNKSSDFRYKPVLLL